MIVANSSDRELERGKIGKYFLTVLAQLAKFGIRKLPVIVVRALPRRENVHDFLRPYRDHRPKHHAVDESEDRGVHADGERERNDRDESKPGTFEKLTKSKTEILNHRWPFP